MGCLSREERLHREKALDVIKQDMLNTMDDVDSYEPIETTLSRLKMDYLSDTLVQNVVNEIRGTDSVIAMKRKEEEEAYRIMRIYSWPPGNREEKKYERELINIADEGYHAREKRNALLDSMLSLVARQNSNLYGWKINHIFRHKGEIYEYVYFMNKDCNQILLKTESSYGPYDIEFANSIYEEALVREKRQTP